MWLFKNLFQKKRELKKTDITKRFDLLNRVGQGTMSRVWKATDTTNGKLICLKVLDKDKMEMMEERFKDLEKPSEGEIAISMDHPNVVKSYEYGISMDDELFLVMDYIDGAGLSVYVELQNEVMEKHRVKWMIQIGEALDYVHKMGYIHRDMCPHNLLVNRQYEIKMIDFGLAVPDKPEFKQPGNRTGKAGYMAPELLKRQKTDIRLDVFSYAVTCYEMWTRQFPYEGGQNAQQLVQSYGKPPKDIRSLNPEIPESIAAIIMKGINADPAGRWQSAKVMVQQFQKYA
jgi:serine/threonine protein kinase